MIFIFVGSRTSNNGSEVELSHAGYYFDAANYGDASTTVHKPHMQLTVSTVAKNLGAHAAYAMSVRSHRESISSRMKTCLI